MGKNKTKLVYISNGNEKKQDHGTKDSLNLTGFVWWKRGHEHWCWCDGSHWWWESEGEDWKDMKKEGGRRAGRVWIILYTPKGL